MRFGRYFDKSVPKSPASFCVPALFGTALVLKPIPVGVCYVASYKVRHPVKYSKKHLPTNTLPKNMWGCNDIGPLATDDPVISNI